MPASIVLPDPEQSPEGIRSQIFVAVMAFLMTFITLFRSFATNVTKRLPLTLSENEQSSQIAQEKPKEQLRPPSPTPAFTEADLLSSVLRKLAELEEKVVTLQAKPTEMPYEKEELLNAAVCRVDALEAELIATKKVGLPTYVSLFLYLCYFIRASTLMPLL